jgi:hypothetical protein
VKVGTRHKKHGSYNLCEYNLSEYNLNEYNLNEYNPTEYNLTEYNFKFKKIIFTFFTNTTIKWFT